MAATESNQSADEQIESTMNSIKKMILISALFVVAGYVLVILGGLESAFTIWDLSDGSKMWLKLGGVGHILVGIFISLVAIIRTLKLVPARLSRQLG